MVPVPFGDRAYRFRLASPAVASAWADAARNASITGIVDVVAAYETVMVVLDPAEGKFEDVLNRLQAILPAEASETRARLIVIPACYDGIDLPEVAARLGLGVEEVIERHVSETYRVMAIGFRPGFPYLGELAVPLRGLSRRDQPRTAVPAGSVAIVGRQTAIYPESSPGGWHLIGQTPVPLVDLKAGWFAFRVGDRVRFRPIDRQDFERIRKQGYDDTVHGLEC